MKIVLARLKDTFSGAYPIPKVVCHENTAVYEVTVYVKQAVYDRSSMLSFRSMVWLRDCIIRHRTHLVTAQGYTNAFRYPVPHQA